MTTTKLTNLEEEALKRKERLLAMKRKFQQNEESETPSSIEEQTENLSLKRYADRPYLLPFKVSVQVLSQLR